MIGISSFVVFSLLAAWRVAKLRRKTGRRFPAGSRKEINPFGATLLLNRLSKLEAEGAYDQALALFGREPLPKPHAADEFATHLTILRIAANCYQVQSDWRNAADCYREAIRYAAKIGYSPRDLEGGLDLCKRQLAGGPAPQTTNYEAAVPNRPAQPHWQASGASA
jgi:tetratricopeptide (TPR) repeat protein